MQTQLEQLEKEYSIEWHGYKVGDLFDIKPTKNYGLSNHDLLSLKGETPVVSNTSVNNGITGYVGLEPTEKGNIITFSDTTTDDAIFYQPNDFIGYSHIQGMYKKFDREIGKLEYLFFVAAFRRAVHGKYNYGSKFNRQNAAKEIIQLPTISKDGKKEIAFDYIEKFVSTLETERLATLETERLATLELYMNVTGLSSYELDLNEKNALNVLEKVTLKEFRMEDVLVWQKNISELNPLHLDSLTISNELKYPFYGQATVNNGVIEYRHLKAEVLNNKLSKPTILIHSNNQNTVYLDTPFYLKDGHGATSVLQSENLNRMTAQFLMTSIKKVILQKYTYNSKATKIELKNTYISLPVKPDNTPDYDYMSTVISAMQKVVIKNVVDYLDQRIEKTKEIIGT